MFKSLMFYKKYKLWISIPSHPLPSIEIFLRLIKIIYIEMTDQVLNGRGNHIIWRKPSTFEFAQQNDKHLETWESRFNDESNYDPWSDALDH